MSHTDNPRQYQKGPDKQASCSTTGGGWEGDTVIRRYPILPMYVLYISFRGEEYKPQPTRPHQIKSRHARLILRGILRADYAVQPHQVHLTRTHANT